MDKTKDIKYSIAALEETKKVIRSLLLSCKDGQPLHLLEKDHMEMMGYPLPFQKLGFPSADALLKNLPDVCRKTIGTGGVEVYKALADEKTAHIAELVARQKPKKVKRCGQSSKVHTTRTSSTGSRKQPHIPVNDTQRKIKNYRQKWQRKKIYPQHQDFQLHVTCHRQVDYHSYYLEVADASYSEGERCFFEARRLSYEGFFHHAQYLYERANHLYSYSQAKYAEAEYYMYKNYNHTRFTRSFR